MARLGVDETMSARVQRRRRPGLGPEAAARRARYAVLEQMAEHVGADAVLLGHTRDDQAETVLLGPGPRVGRPLAGRDAAPLRALPPARCSTSPATTP